MTVEMFKVKMQGQYGAATDSTAVSGMWKESEGLGIQERYHASAWLLGKLCHDDQKLLYFIRLMDRSLWHEKYLAMLGIDPPFYFIDKH
jgi:hypothetical protein